MIVAEYASRGKKIRSPEEVTKVLREVADRIVDPIDRDKERFYSIGLNGGNGIKWIDEVSVGTLNASLVHPREVFKRAVNSGMASLIIAHNHPSSECDPSAEDRAVTMQLCEAGRILGIPIIDHVIFSQEKMFSFAKEGLIK